MKAGFRTLALGVIIAVSTVMPAAATIWYVSLAGSDASNGLSWDAAKRTIQAAIDAAASNDLVLVTNGVYASGGRVVVGTVTNRVAITNQIVVQSVNGPDVTMIAGAGPAGNSAIRCAYVGSNAWLSGFTLTNGNTRTSGYTELDQSGGGAWCQVGGTLSNCVLCGNTAYYRGGGCYQGSLYDCSLISNSAASGGGSFASWLGSCMLKWNTVSGNGGGALNGTLTNCFLLGNAAYAGGGAYGVTIDNSVLITNRANFNAGQGGGLHNSLAAHCMLASNWARFGGGSYGGALTECTLRDNFARTDGGGAHSGYLTNCLLTGNSVETGGGGAKDGYLYGCVLFGNRALMGGGTYQTTVRGSAFANNWAANGGAAYIGVLYNCVLIGNSAYRLGGGVDSASLFNCIVYYNDAPSAADISGSPVNCCFPLASSLGNITNEPAMIDLTHVSPISPCLAAGSATNAAGTDFDGELWRDPPAIGCDEQTPGANTGRMDVAILASYDRIATAYPMNFAGYIRGRVSACSWDFGDGSAVASNRPYLKHTFATAGTYAVVFRGFNDDHPEGSSTTTFVEVVESPIYYVDKYCATPAAPYLTWNTAATTIQSAIDAAIPGSTVLVTNGIYDTGGRVVYGWMTNRVVIDKPLLVRSVNGSRSTMIMGAGPMGDTAVRCVYIGDGATLADFTLTNGYTRGNGVAIEERSGGGARIIGAGILTNCLVTGNMAMFGGGVCYGYVNNCTLMGNTAGGYTYSLGGGTHNSMVNHSAIISNIAQRGGGVSGGSVNNCLLAGNAATIYGGWGGGAVDGVLSNCTVYGNTAARGGGLYNCAAQNCIVWSNVAADEPNCSTSRVSYSCTIPQPGGSGNITNDPVFLNVATGSYRLAAASPCIDRGAFLPVATLCDMDGRPRVVNWIVDMGAYEYQGVVNADTDGDGIPNAWEGPSGLDPAVTNGPTADADDDGWTDGEEYLADTSPTNAMSAYPAFQVIGPAPDGLTLEVYPTSTGRVYEVYLSTNLLDAPQAWLGQGAAQTGTGGRIVFAITNEAPPSAFRTGIRLP